MQPKVASVPDAYFSFSIPQSAFRIPHFSRLAG